MMKKEAVKQLISIHPKSFVAMKSWLLDRAKVSATLVEEKDVDGVLITLMIFQPRQLFDFFDSKGVFIGITPQEEGGFIHYNTKDVNSFHAESREEADERAIQNAFKVLETIL